MILTAEVASGIGPNVETNAKLWLQARQIIHHHGWWQQTKMKYEDLEGCGKKMTHLCVWWMKARPTSLSAKNHTCHHTYNTSNTIFSARKITPVTACRITTPDHLHHRFLAQKSHMSLNIVGNWYTIFSSFPSWTPTIHNDHDRCIDISNMQ